MSAVGEHLAVAALSSAVAVVYMALWQEPSLLAILVKILPCLFLFLHLSKKHLEDKRWKTEASALDTLLRLTGRGPNEQQQQQQRSTKSKKETGGKVSQRQALQRRQLREGIAMGLLWSLLGDVLLIWIADEVPFLLGMLAFGVAQVCYIRGLGFSSTNKLTGAAIYAVLGAVVVFVLQDAPLHFWIPIPLYAAALTTTLWRALDRYGYDDGRSKMQKGFTVLGALTFVISDTCIAVSMFVADVNHAAASAVIHTTYFAAQTLLALGAA